MNLFNFGPARVGEPTVFGAEGPDPNAVDDWVAFMRGEDISRVVCLLSEEQLGAYRMLDGGLLDEYARRFPRGRLSQPIDEFGLPTHEELSEIFQFLEEAERDGERVVVHCQAGRGRTAVVLAGWLRYARGLDPEEAIRSVQGAPGTSRDPLECGRPEDARALLAAVKPNPAASRACFDLQFRPSSYWPDDPLVNALSQLDDERLRQRLVELFESADEEELQRFLERAGVGAREREALLLELRAGDDFLEEGFGRADIATIFLDSRFGDCISISAQVDADLGIRYSITDECDTTYAFSPERSALPLTMGELIRLIDTAEWGDQRGLVMGYRAEQMGMDPEELESFVTVSSDLYPQLANYYKDEAAEWVKRTRKELDEVDDAHADEDEYARWGWRGWRGRAPWRAELEPGRGDVTMGQPHDGGVARARRLIEASLTGADVGPDVGPDMLNFLFRAFSIDTAWAVREARSFRWWPHRLAQRVWAEAPHHAGMFTTVRVHVETDVLRGVPTGLRTFAGLAIRNVGAFLSAFVFDPGEGTVRLHASAVVHEENAGRLRLLLLSALALQAHEAHATAEELAKRIGGEPDFSSHPRSGTREDPDEVFGVIARAYASAGRQHSPFRGDDCVALLNMQPQPWLTATGDEEGITAEFPFHHAVPVASGALRRAEADPPGGTARLQVMVEEDCPPLGSGARLVLALPISTEDDLCDELINELNLAEGTKRDVGYSFGAWCHGDGFVWFMSFVPALMCRWVPGLLQALATDAGVRVAWVREYLVARGRGERADD